MKQNINTLNAIMRMTAGLTVLVWATAQLARRPFQQSILIIAMMGAMKVAEGVTRYCPLTAIIENSQEAAEPHQEDVINPS